MPCSRCGAEFKEDPSCGKTEHLTLPSRNDDKIAVWLWDEIGTEWGPAYIAPRHATNNLAAHTAAMKFIDYEAEDDEEIVYQVRTLGLSINVGWWSRHHLFIEMWGPLAEKVIAQLKVEYDEDDAWYPDSRIEAVVSLLRVHDLVRRA